jgi:hypothetical protein
LSSNKINAEKIQNIFKNYLNFAQIYEESRKVILRSFYRTKNLTTFEVFENSQHENLSQILFPDKAKNLNGFQLLVAFDTMIETILIDEKVYNKWLNFIQTIAEKLNATLKLISVQLKGDSEKIFKRSQLYFLKKYTKLHNLDFYLDTFSVSLDLQSYTYIEHCFLVPLPPDYPIYQLILFKPLDKSCWMWLGITIAVSTLVWRIFEGHWNFLFGSCAKFVGQFVEIKT